MIISVYPSSVTWGTTWTTSSNGPIHAAISVSSDVVEAWGGDVLYSMFSVGMNFSCRCTCTIQDTLAETSALNSSNQFSMTVSDGKGNTQTLTATSAVLVGSTHSQPRGLGTQVLELECGTADGTTSPLS